MAHIALPSIDVRRKLNAKLLLAFGIVAMLLLTTFAAMVVKPVNPLAQWWFAPGAYTMHVQPGSSRGITTTIGGFAITIAPPALSTAFPICDSYDVVFGAPGGNGLVAVTVPQASFISKPFYIRSITLPGIEEPFYLWSQLGLVGDGTGTLDTVGGNIDLDVTVTVNGLGGPPAPGVPAIVPGSTGPPGSMIIDMPLQLTIYLGTSPTDPTLVWTLIMIPFTTYLTTGQIGVTIIDQAPFPAGTDSLDGYTTSAQGVPVDPLGSSATVVTTWGGLDFHFMLLGADLYIDFMFEEVEVFALQIITEVTVLPTEAYQDQQVCNRIYSIVTGVNQLAAAADITVTVTAEGPQIIIIDTTTIANVAPGATIEISATWNTTAAFPGTYTIKVDAQVNDVTSVDTWIAGTVKVFIPGDIDGDGDVDVIDFIVFGGKYGQHYSV